MGRGVAQAPLQEGERRSSGRMPDKQILRRQFELAERLIWDKSCGIALRDPYYREELKIRDPLKACDFAREHYQQGSLDMLDWAGRLRPALLQLFHGAYYADRGAEVKDNVEMISLKGDNLGALEQQVKQMVYDYRAVKEAMRYVTEEIYTKTHIAKYLENLATSGDACLVGIFDNFDTMRLAGRFGLDIDIHKRARRIRDFDAAVLEYLELPDLKKNICNGALEVLEPKVYELLKSAMLGEHQKKEEKKWKHLKKGISDVLSSVLAENGFEGFVQGDLKAYYSIYEKIRKYERREEWVDKPEILWGLKDLIRFTVVLGGKNNDLGSVYRFLEALNKCGFLARMDPAGILSAKDATPVNFKDYNEGVSDADIAKGTSAQFKGISIIYDAGPARARIISDTGLPKAAVETGHRMFEVRLVNQSQQGEIREKASHGGYKFAGEPETRALGEKMAELVRTVHERKTIARELRIDVGGKGVGKHQNEGFVPVEFDRKCLEQRIYGKVRQWHPRAKIGEISLSDDMMDRIYTAKRSDIRVVLAEKGGRIVADKIIIKCEKG